MSNAHGPIDFFPGVRISHNDPRAECGSRDKPADGLYDIEKADALVMPSVIR